MKYLVIAKDKPGAQIPPDKLLPLLQATKAFIKSKLADGTVDCAYYFADFVGCAIANANSHEEIMNLLIDFPWPYDWEVRPLCDFEQTVDRIIESAKASQ